MLTFFYYLLDYSYDYGTDFWKIKRGLFTCKCGTDNCCFSEKTSKKVFLDSDNDDLWSDNKSCSNERDVSAVKVPNACAIKTNKINASKPQPCGTKRCEDNSVLLSKNGHKQLCVGKNSSMAASGHQNITSREMVLENGLSKKNKLIRVVKTKEPNKSVSNQLLKITDGHSTKNSGPHTIKKKLHQVIFTKKTGDKFFNGNSSLGNCRKVSRTNNELLFKNKSKVSKNEVSSQLMNPVNNKVTKTYILRPKMPSPNKQVVNNVKSENAVVSDNIIFMSNDLTNKSIFSGDASSSYQKTVGDLNERDQSMDSIKSESVVSEESKTYRKVNSGIFDFSESSKMYLSEEELRV